MSDKVIEEKNPLRVSIDFRENSNKGAVFDYTRQSIKLFIFHSLESFIKSDIDARELKRAIAVRMALSGNIYNEISKILGVSNFFIGYWKKQFKTKGIAGIKLGHKGSK